MTYNERQVEQQKESQQPFQRVHLHRLIVAQRVNLPGYRSRIKPFPQAEPTQRFLAGPSKQHRAKLGVVTA
jgi:hypothetical protein